MLSRILRGFPSLVFIIMAKQILWYIILALSAGGPIFLLFYIGKGLFLRTRRLWPLVHSLRSYFVSDYPALETYGYKIIHSEIHERIFASPQFTSYHLNKYRIAMIFLLLGGILEMQWIKVRALAWGLKILTHFRKLYKDPLSMEQIRTFLVRQKGLLDKQRIDITQREFKILLDNNDLRSIDRDFFLSLLLFNQIIQEIESAEKMLLLDPAEELKAMQSACKELAEVLDRFLHGEKYAVYNEILQRRRKYSHV